MIIEKLNRKKMYAKNIGTNILQCIHEIRKIAP